jgi:hypothetical protein
VSSRISPLVESLTGRAVNATVIDGLSPEQVIAAEATWRPFRQTDAMEAGEHSHWDWSLKTGLLVEPGVRCLGVECEGQMQGMMMVREIGHVAHLAPDAGQPLVYIEYLESAPWNLLRPNQPPRYRRVGTTLLRAAIERSREIGFDGRVGLHSLPQATAFYERKCRMISHGPDPRYYGLVYFEYTAEAAQRYQAEDQP